MLDQEFLATELGRLSTRESVSVIVTSLAFFQQYIALGVFLNKIPFTGWEDSTGIPKQLQLESRVELADSKLEWFSVVFIVNLSLLFCFVVVGFFI